MSNKVARLLEQVLRLTSKDRVIIAERLLSSLDKDMDVEMAWQKELQKRVEAVDNGEVVCLPWEEVRRVNY